MYSFRLRRISCERLQSRSAQIAFRVSNNSRGNLKAWPAPGSEDTELGVFMGAEVSHGETKVYAGVQA